jgi:2'-5' RNA ligase
MRLFFAADIDRDINGRVNETIARLKTIDPSVKWVRPENHHVTLYFFGEADEKTRSSIEGILECATGGVRPFRVSVGGISAFPSVDRPRVLWIGLVNTGGELARMYTSIREALLREKLPVNVENRDLTPHLTIGRVKERCSSALTHEVRRSGDTAFGEFEVNSVVLYQSVLRREGPLYTPLKTIILS